MRNTFLWVGWNIFSRSRGERPLPKRLGSNWKWFKFQMCFRNIQITKTENCVLKAVQQIKCADIKGWLFFHIVLNLNLNSHFVQKYTRAGDGTTLGGGCWVRAGVNTKSHDSKRMETCLWFSSCRAHLWLCADIVLSLLCTTVASPPQRQGLGEDKDDYCCRPPTRYSAVLGLC